MKKIFNINTIYKLLIKMSHVCDKCGKKFSNKYNLENHKNKKKPCVIAERYNCPKCKKHYYDSSNLKRHLKTCKAKKHKQEEKIIDEEIDENENKENTNNEENDSKTGNNNETEDTEDTDSDENKTYRLNIDVISDAKDAKEVSTYIVTLVKQVIDVVLNGLQINIECLDRYITYRKAKLLKIVCQQIKGQLFNETDKADDYINSIISGLLTKRLEEVCTMRFPELDFSNIDITKVKQVLIKPKREDSPKHKKHHKKPREDDEEPKHKKHHKKKHEDDE